MNEKYLVNYRYKLWFNELKIGNITLKTHKNISLPKVAAEMKS